MTPWRPDAAVTDHRPRDKRGDASEDDEPDDEAQPPVAAPVDAAATRDLLLTKHVVLSKRHVVRARRMIVCFACRNLILCRQTYRSAS